MSIAHLAYDFTEAHKRDQTPVTWDAEHHRYRPLTAGEITKAKRYIARADKHQAFLVAQFEAEDRAWVAIERARLKTEQANRVTLATNQLRSASAGMARIYA